MMDRYCEYCVNLRSVVYCKADAAYLCLSCDTKVHSANPLSNRHHRTLICDTCRRRPTYIQCYDHHKFMCRACDLNQHDASSQHRKRFVNSYMGCPSARDLGVLWGFDLNKFNVDGSIGLNHIYGSASSPSTNTMVTGLVTNLQVKAQEVNALQQLVDMLKIQTCDIEPSSSIVRCQEQKVDNEDDHYSLHLDHHDMSLDDACSSPFTQLDHLESETDETDLQGDSYWQCKSPVLSNQLWSQNMQDLGVCEEEPSCLDDLNMPDIDLTFKNFEELFRIDHESTRVDSVKALEDTESSPKKARYASQILSYSHSRVSAESSGMMCINGSGISPSCGSIEHHEPLEGKKNFHMKESKQGECGYRKARSDTRKRTKSQNWKFESYESVARC